MKQRKLFGTTIDRAQISDATKPIECGILVDLTCPSTPNPHLDHVLSSLHKLLDVRRARLHLSRVLGVPCHQRLQYRLIATVSTVIQANRKRTVMPLFP